MHAMVLDAAGKMLQSRSISVPEPGPDQLLVKIAACAVCRTDLHVVDGELPIRNSPLFPATKLLGAYRLLERMSGIFLLANGLGIPG